MHSYYTLDGVATGVRAACLRAVRRRLPRLSGLGKLEEMRREVRDAYDEVEAATRRVIEQAEEKYNLVYEVARLAPNFGRSRGRLRGAAGGYVPLGAGRTRMNLDEAKIAVNLACGAWGASERALEGMLTECARIGRCTQVIGRRHVQLMGMCRRKGRREGLTGFVGRMHRRSTAWLAAAKTELDKYYWGVWGSARRCKASAREVRVLEAALHDAEHGDWYDDLPGGSTWMEAAAAAVKDAVQLGGECAQAFEVGCSAGCAVRRGGGSRSDGSGGNLGCMHEDGRQAADGGHADCGRRGSDGSGRPWVLWQRRCERLLSDGARWQGLVVLQAMEQLTGEELAEGGVMELAYRARRPVRTRLWWAWRYRRRRRLWAPGA
eukprot:SAG11_NODE_332_length_10621_cov_13.178768_13_plen_378_part_00